MTLFEINSRKGFPSKTEELLLFFVINIDLFVPYKNVKQKIQRPDAFLCSLKIRKVEDA